MAFTHNSKVADREPPWAEGIDRTALPRIAFARMGDPDRKSTWGYPHHWIQDGSAKNEDGIYTKGTMYLHRRGLQVAWNYAMGAGTGERAERGVVAHLRGHFRELGIKKADIERATSVLINMDALDQDLIDHGFFTAEQLADPDLTEQVARLVHR